MADILFLRKVVDLLICHAIEAPKDINSKVVNFVPPESLREILDLSLPEEGCKDEDLLALCKTTVHYSVKTGHRHFFNQLFAGQCHYGLAGSWLSEAVSTNMYTYEMSPVFTLIERELIHHMAKFIGFKTCDGLFNPGGSVSNMYGLHLARYHKFPEVKEKGLQALPALCVFASGQSHYSLVKGLNFLGFGSQAFITVPSDVTGRLIPSELEAAIIKAKAEGLHPFYVHANAGTTVTGAYDPLDAISDVCLRHDLWLHVDGCWGGGALLSRKHRHLMNGIERADSVAWNPHKLMAVPPQCCAFITPHEGLLKQCNETRAQYIFQDDKYYDGNFDSGEKSIQCSRRNDVFKLWLMWKAKGDHGFEENIDIIFSNARYLADKITSTDGFELVFPEPQCTNVCFWYLPPALRNRRRNEQWWKTLSKVAPLIKRRMVAAGTMMITYNPLPEAGKVNFLRMVIINPITTHADMDFVLEEIHRLGKDIDFDSDNCDDNRKEG